MYQFKIFEIDILQQNVSREISIPKLDLDPIFFKKPGPNYTGPGFILAPFSIECGPDGEIYIVETTFNRIHILSSNFDHIWTGTHAEGDKNFNMPYLVTPYYSSVGVAQPIQNDYGLALYFRAARMENFQIGGPFTNGNGVAFQFDLTGRGQVEIILTKPSGKTLNSLDYGNQLYNAGTNHFAFPIEEMDEFGEWSVRARFRLGDIHSINPDVISSASFNFSVFSPSTSVDKLKNNGNGTYNVSFGYENINLFDVFIPIGGENYFNYQGSSHQNLGQPIKFESGRKTSAFSVDFDGSNLVWHLNGRTSTASSGKKISPILDELVNNGDGNYTAIFGYNNENPFPVEIPFNNQNRFAYKGNVNLNLSQPTFFQPKRHRAIFSTHFDGSNLVWHLNKKTATASKGKKITPVLESITINGEDKVTAYFGYHNPNPFTVVIPTGNENKFDYLGKTTLNLGQSERFSSQRHQNTFSIDFNGSNLVWHLNKKTATASRGKQIYFDYC